MAEARWKRVERETARSMGAERLPNNGRGQPDFLAGPLAAEHKLRASIPQWFMEVVEQARRNAPPGKVAVAILTVPRGRGRKPLRLAILAWDDFLKLYGKGA